MRGCGEFEGFAPCRRPLQLKASISKSEQQFANCSLQAGGLKITGNVSSWQPAAVDRLIGAMGVPLYLRLSFLNLRHAFSGTWDTILVILGSRGTPNGHTDAQMSVSIDF